MSVTQRMAVIKLAVRVKVHQENNATVAVQKIALHEHLYAELPVCSLGFVCAEVELDEQWSYMGNKPNQRWL